MHCVDQKMYDGRSSENRLFEMKKAHLYQYVCAVRGYGKRDVVYGARVFYLYYRQHTGTHRI